MRKIESDLNIIKHTNDQGLITYELDLLIENCESKNQVLEEAKRLIQGEEKENE